MTDDHGRCPSCGVSLTGDTIWQTFMDKHGDEAEADRIAEMFGADRTQGRWGRAIGIYDRDRDRTVAWQCPDCQHEWPR